MSKYTPEPWTMEEHRGVIYILEPGVEVDYDNGERILAREEQVANAQLIIAAPKLLKALKNLLVVAPMGQPEYREAKIIIAKATSESLCLP